MTTIAKYPNRSVATSPTTPSITGAFIHWLSVRYKNGFKGEILSDLSKALGLECSILKNASKKVLSDHFAYEGKVITKNGSLLLLSKNGANTTLIINGSDCLNVKNWHAFKELLKNLPGCAVNRVDLAIDIQNITLADIIESYTNGNFKINGKTPTITPIGNFVNDDGQARTVNIGKRSHGKMLRAYEISRKLNLDKSIIRLEVEIHNSKIKSIPLDVLTDPLSYFCGAYPYLARFGSGNTKIMDYRKVEKQSEYAKKIEYAKLSYGPLINLMMEVEGSAEKVVGLLKRPSYPENLSPDPLKELTHPKITDDVKIINILQRLENRFTGLEDKIDKFIQKPTNKVELTPRRIRLKDAPKYLGTSKNIFNKDIRPYLQQQIVGHRGIAFDRLDLDAIVDENKFRTGCSKFSKGENVWDSQKPEPKASTRKLMDQKQLVKHGKEKEFIAGSATLVKKKPKHGYTMKSKKENANSSVEKAPAICLQSAHKGI